VFDVRDGPGGGVRDCGEGVCDCGGGGDGCRDDSCLCPLSATAKIAGGGIIVPGEKRGRVDPAFSGGSSWTFSLSPTEEHETIIKISSNSNS